MDKGLVNLPIGSSSKVEAFHAPKFSSSIISVGILSEAYELEFSKSIRGYRASFFMRLETYKILTEVPLKNGLYPLTLPMSDIHSYDVETFSKKKNEVDEWHRKFRHLSAQNFNQPAELHPDIPKFEQSTLPNINAYFALLEKRNDQPFFLRLAELFGPLSSST